MRLISLKFEDSQAGWQLEETEFFPDLTLLVGLSGVGKTRILDTIKRLQQIAGGKFRGDNWGISWKLQFVEGDHEYVWSGEFETRDDDQAVEGFIGSFPEFDEELQQKPKIIQESLLRNGHVLAARKGEEITLNGKKTPRLSQEESIVYLFRFEESISDAHKGMDAILYVDHSEASSGLRIHLGGQHFEALMRKLTTLEEIRNEDLPTSLKLALAYKNCPETFAQIEEQFKDAFPYVEKLKVEFIDAGPFGKTPRVVLHEVGVDKPIPEESISSGMMRTLMHLSRMALWPDGTVVLIDEFENSFGINCINFVTDDLITQSHRLQFILTSHHPYIINNINMKNWKIVTRNGRKVSVKDSSILDGTSSHEAFLQLLNLPEYAEGITTG